MAFSFVDTFTGAARTTDALLTHTPDATADSLQLAAVAATSPYTALSGSGILYSAHATYAIAIRLLLNTSTNTFVASPLSFDIEGLQGWLNSNASAALPVSDTDILAQLSLFTSIYSEVRVTVRNRATSLVIAGGAGYYGYTLPAGMSVSLAMNTVDRGDPSLGPSYPPDKVPTYVAAISATAPFDFKLTATSSRAAVRVNNVLLLESETCLIGDLALYLATFDLTLPAGVGASAVRINSNTPGPISLNFWTGFVETAETS